MVASNMDRYSEPWLVQYILGKNCLAVSKVLSTQVKLADMNCSRPSSMVP